MNKIYFLLFLQLPLFLFSQDCSYEAALAKYNQYQRNFDRHFIVNDRDSTGCINDGIGADPDNPCDFSKGGYGLPISHIIQNWSGADAFGEKNDPNSPHYDADCASRTHWDPATQGKRFNYASYSSETLIHLGWNIMNLCLQYDLYGKANDSISQKKVLEELFLALQAVRRLDMQAQCVFNELYDKRKTGLICPKIYSGKKHNTLTGVDVDSCNFEEDLSGYAGFLIREDANQNLAKILHDSTQEQYNVDAIGSVSAALSDPCKKDLDERACWLYYSQGFMSQDQIIGLLTGLAFVKRFIPDNIEVTLCDGSKHKVLEIAQKTTNSIVNRIDNDYRGRIKIPGTPHCSNESQWHKNGLFLNNFEGGECTATIRGMKKMQKYITGSSRKQGLLGWFVAGGLKASTWFDDPEGHFWLRMSVVEEDGKNDNFVENCQDYCKEIYLLMNEILNPGAGNLKASGISKEQILSWLCMAPCTGLCTKEDNYNIPYDSIRPHPRFECPNTPFWGDNRWDDAKDCNEVNDYKNSKYYPKNRISNGLDFMSLFLCYSNLYNERIDKKGARLQGDHYFRDRIVGREIVCPNENAEYILRPYYADSIHNLISSNWTSSPNIRLFNTTKNSSDAFIISASFGSNIEVETKEIRKIDQHATNYKPYWKDSIRYDIGSDTIIGIFRDECELSYIKPIATELPTFEVIEDVYPCNVSVYLENKAGISGNNTFLWNITNRTNGRTMTSTSLVPDLYIIIDKEENGIIEYTVTITNDCGTQVLSGSVQYTGCDGDDTKLRISPNPSDGKAQFYIESLPEGFTVYGQLSDGSSTLNQYFPITNNPSYQDFSTLPSGSYNINYTVNGIQNNATFIILK
jgi:hypothetical protein